MSAQLQPGGAPTASGDPTQGATTGDPTSDETGAVICIAAMPDGTFSIYEQESDDSDDSQDASGGSDAGDTDDQKQTADNVDDALAIAKQMLEQESGEDESGEDGNSEMSPGDAKAAWNQMASKRDKKRAMGM